MSKSALIKKERKVDWNKMKPDPNDVKKVVSHMDMAKLRSKVWVHNGIIVGVYGLCMVLTIMFAVEFAMMFVAFIIGSQNAAVLSDLTDMIAIYVAIVMGSGITMFFTFKLENALIAAIKRRMWRISNGDIVKPEMNCVENK